MSTHRLPASALHAPGNRGRRTGELLRLASCAALAAAPAASAAQGSGAPGVSIAAERALERLDARLGAVESGLAVRGEHVNELTSAVSRGEAGVLVVLLRTDASAPSELARATITMDGVHLRPRLYYADQREALAAGGADELHRAASAAVPHTITLEAAVGRGTLARTLRVVPAGGGRTTYVEFVVRAGELAGAAWATSEAAKED